MTPVSLLDIRHWHLSQFIVYGGQRNAAPAPGRLRAEQWSSPGKVSDAASHRHQPHQPQTPHSGKINALHSELWWQDNLYQEHIYMMFVKYISHFVPDNPSPWSPVTAQRALHCWIVSRLVVTDQAPAPHVSCLRSRSYTTIVSTFAFTESKSNGT